MEKVIMMIPVLIVVGGLGIVIGSYLAGKIKCSIRKNIFKNNLENYEQKEKIKQQKSKIHGQKPVNWT